MISFSCPYCDKSYLLEIPCGRAGNCEVRTCDSCGKTFFIHLSRWRPHIYTPDQVRINELDMTVEIVDLEAKQKFEADYREAMDVVLVAQVHGIDIQ